MSDQEYRPGLDGVIASITKLSYLDTEIEQIVVRGYDLIELIQQKSYVDVTYLLIHGNLPSAEEAKKFESDLMDDLEEKPVTLYEVK